MTTRYAFAAGATANVNVTVPLALLIEMYGNTMLPVAASKTWACIWPFDARPWVAWVMAIAVADASPMSAVYLPVAPRLVRAAGAAVAPVPPWATSTAVAFQTPVVMVPRVTIAAWPGQAV